MDDFNKQREKFINQCFGLLNEEERSQIEDCTDSEIVQDYQLLVDSVKKQAEVNPDGEIRTLLINQFKDKYSKQSKNVSKSNRFLLQSLKVAASTVFIIGIGMIFFYQTSKSSEISKNEIEMEEFNKYTQLNNTSNAEDSIANETKFLMSVDFFSNSGIVLEMN